MRSSIFTQPSFVNVQLQYRVIQAYNLDISLTEALHKHYKFCLVFVTYIDKYVGIVV